MTYQVVALYEDAEVGYGESEIYEDAAREAAESVPDLYPADDVVLCCTRGAVEVKTPLALWLAVCG